MNKAIRMIDYLYIDQNTTQADIEDFIGDNILHKENVLGIVKSDETFKPLHYGNYLIKDAINPCMYDVLSKEEFEKIYMIIPKLKRPNGSDIFNDYVKGYNEAIGDILRKESEGNK